jgi:hypothetical protein
MRHTHKHTLVQYVEQFNQSIHVLLLWWIVCRSRNSMRFLGGSRSASSLYTEKYMNMVTPPRVRVRSMDPLYAAQGREVSFISDSEHSTWFWFLLLRFLGVHKIGTLTLYREIYKSWWPFLNMSEGALYGNTWLLSSPCYPLYRDTGFCSRISKRREPQVW